MPKSYYQGDKLIIPFNKISAVADSRYTKYIVEVFCNDNSFGITKDNYKTFLTQYTAWLDTQSTPQL